MLLVDVLAFLAGAAVVAIALVSAIRTFIVPRGISDRLTSFVFRTMRRLFDL